jgi:signal transduction histidine kinase
VGDGEQDSHLWRALHFYRLATYAYAVVLFLRVAGEYRNPVGAWAVLGAMGLWTGYLVRCRRRDTPVMVLDLAVSVAAVLSTAVLDDPDRIAAGAQTLPTIWASAVVLAWAVWRGWQAGLFAAVTIAVADVVEVGGGVSPTTSNNIVLLLLAGTVVGYNTSLFLSGRRDLARAVAIEAASRERERLAADIHDSVLQVLAYVRRRGQEAGGEAAEIGRLAGEQEARLRSLIANGPAEAVVAGEQDLRALLTGLAHGRVTVSGPAGPVLLPREVAVAVAGAVGAALENVRCHAGAEARAWVFVEDEETGVTVSVRDDGVGFAEGRLAAAAAEGRLGVPLSIRARMTNVGGTAEVISRPGEGTEVELWVPRTGTRRM